MKRTSLAIFALLLAVTTGQAQAPGGPPGGAPAPAIGEIRGTIKAAADSTPVQGASVAVRSRRDSSLVTGTTTAADGTFHVQGLRPGTYYLRVAAVGFSPRSSIDIVITPANPTARFDNITLNRFAVSLQAVTVEGAQSVVTIAPDRNSYRAKDVAPAAANASEVLQATPSVEVDADGKVSLRGNENVAVQINGRPAPIRGEQLGAYLKQLPAGIIERIEVVPTPSASQDPEGMAGIINIVLKENVDLGLSGGINVGASPAQRYNGSGNIGYQTGPWTWMGTYGFNSDQRNIFGINDRERHTALLVPLSYTEQDVAGEAQNGGHNMNLNLDYKVNARDLFSNALSMNVRRSTDGSLTGYSELNGTRLLVTSYDRLRDAEVKGFMFDYLTAFKRSFVPNKHTILGELRYNRQDDDDKNTLWRQPLSASTQTELEDNHTQSLTNQLTAKMDYVRPLGERTKLETGYKGNGIWIDREFTVLEDPLGTGSWVRDARSNAFDFNSQVHAIYGVFSHGVGSFELQGGLRAEKATRDFILATETFPYNYTSLLPSGVVSYKFSERTNLKLAYSRRVRRPGTQELNPFPTFFDPQNVFIGNPNLDPEYTDAFELSWSRNTQKTTLQLSPFYRRTTDIIRFIIDTDDVIDGREVTSVTFENLATGTSWGTDVNGALRLGPKLNVFSGFNIFKMVTDGGSASSLASGGVTWSGRINASSQITPVWMIQGQYFYRAPMNVERGKFSGSQFTSFVVRRKLNGDKASISFRFVDPFNTLGFRVEAGDDNITQITERKFSAREMRVNFQYNFGRPPQVRQPTEQQPAPQPVFGQ